MRPIDRLFWYEVPAFSWRASSGDGTPKLQISVPCRGRTCPERSFPFHDQIFLVQGNLDGGNSALVIWFESKPILRPHFHLDFKVNSRRRGQTRIFLTIPFTKLRGNVVRTFLGKSDFYWPLMLLAEQWQCSLYANVLFVQSSVPTMFLHIFLQTDGLQTDGSRLFRNL